MRENFHEHGQEDTPLFREQRFIWGNGGGAETQQPGKKDEAAADPKPDGKEKGALPEKEVEKRKQTIINKLKDNPKKEAIKKAFKDHFEGTKIESDEILEFAKIIERGLKNVNVSIPPEMRTQDHTIDLAKRLGFITYTVAVDRKPAKTSGKRDAASRKLNKPRENKSFTGSSVETSRSAMVDAISDHPDLVEEGRRLMHSLSRARRNAKTPFHPATKSEIVSLHNRIMRLPEVQRMDQAELKDIAPKSDYALLRFLVDVSKAGSQKADEEIAYRYGDLPMDKLQGKLKEVQLEKWKMARSSARTGRYGELTRQYRVLNKIFTERNDGISFVRHMRVADKEYEKIYNERNAYYQAKGEKMDRAYVSKEARNQADLVILKRWRQRGMLASQYRGDRKAKRRFAERVTGMDLSQRERTNPLADFAKQNRKSQEEQNARKVQFLREQADLERQAKRDINRVWNPPENPAPAYRLGSVNGVKKSGGSLLVEVTLGKADQLKSGHTVYFYPSTPDGTPPEQGSEVMGTVTTNVRKNRAVVDIPQKPALAQSPNVLKGYKVSTSKPADMERHLKIKSLEAEGAELDAKMADEKAKEEQEPVTKAPKPTPPPKKKPSKTEDSPDEIERKAKELEKVLISAAKEVGVGFKIETVEYRNVGKHGVSVVISNHNKEGELAHAEYWDVLHFDSRENVDSIEAQVRERLMWYKEMQNAVAKMADSIRKTIGGKLPDEILIFEADPSVSNDELFEFNFYTSDKKGGPKITIEKCDPEKWETQLGKHLEGLRRYMKDIEGDLDTKESKEKKG